MNIADRLRAILDASGMTREALIKELRDRGVQGGSYPSLRTYLSGEVEPSLEFLRATAEVCGVSPAWLTFGDDGDGPRPVWVTLQVDERVVFHGLVKSGERPSAPPPHRPSRNGYARRLEELRSRTGLSLKAFWQFVHRDVPPEQTPSYDAVRTWHADREPPVSYIAHVAAVCRVPLEDLVYGE